MTGNHAAPHPVVHRGDLSVFDVVRADDAFLCIAGCRAYGKNAHPVAIVFGAVAVEYCLLQRVKANEALAL